MIVTLILIMDFWTFLFILLFLLLEKNNHTKYHRDYIETNDLSKDFVYDHFYHERNDIIINYVLIISCIDKFYKIEEIISQSNDTF